MASNVLELISDATTTERKVEIIEGMVTQKVLNYISQDELPTELEYIVQELTIKRFNRLGSEGMSSTSQEGLSMSWNDDDFSFYKDDLDAWLEENNPENNKRWVLWNA